MSITRNDNGSITLSKIINNQLVIQTYYFYTIREAKQMFKQYIKEIQ